MRRMDDAVLFLLRVGTEYGVTWSGELPLVPDEQWQRWVREASAASSSTGDPTEVTTGGVLRCTSGDAAAAGEGGGRLVWPEFDQDQQFRLLSALVKKAEQTRAAGAAWIWFEDAGAVWPRTPFAATPISEKIDTLVDVLDDLFRSNPHIVGVVLTSGEAGPINQADASVEHARGAGFVRLLPTGRLRESVIVHRELTVPGQLELVRQLCASEPTWLDNALILLGARRIHDLVTTPLPRTSALYLP
jgi:hypothetical protein